MDLTLTPLEVGQAQFNNGSITDLHTKNCRGSVLAWSKMHITNTLMLLFCSVFRPSGIFLAQTRFPGLKWSELCNTMKGRDPTWRVAAAASHTKRPTPMCKWKRREERINTADAQVRAWMCVHVCSRPSPSLGELNPIFTSFFFKKFRPTSLLLTHGVPIWAQHQQQRSPRLKITLKWKLKNGKLL